jgi:hypothetical protein
MMVYKAMRHVTKITLFRVTIATNCRALTRCMNVNYIVGHEQARSLLFRCILHVLWVVTISCSQYVKSSIVYMGECLQMTVFLLISFVGDGVKRRPRHNILNTKDWK